MKKRLLVLVGLIIAMTVSVGCFSGCDTIREWGEDITKVTITSEDSFKVTESLQLTAEVVKSSAPDKTLRWEIVESANTTAAGANISNEKLYATGIGQIEIKVTTTAREKIFDTKIITVVKEPVIAIINTNEKTDSFTYESVSEKFDTSDLSTTDWKGSSGKVRMINDTDGGYTGSFRVQMGDDKDYLYKEMYLGYNDSITIAYKVRNSTAGSIKPCRYMVRITNDEGKTWHNISETLSTGGTSWQSASVTIPGSTLAENVAERNVWVAFYVVERYATGYLDDITYVVTSRIASFSAGSSLTLTSKVLPENATFPDITYEQIGDSPEAEVTLIGDVLSSTKPCVIKVTPKADGIVGKPFLVRAT